MARGKDGLCSDQNRLRFILRHLSSGVRTFADIRAVRLYITAANLNTGQVFGSMVFFTKSGEVSFVPPAGGGCCSAR